MFDIIGQSCLKDIKELGLEHAVIAGGMARDHILGGDWSDIDIFIPVPAANKYGSTSDLMWTDKALEKFKYIDNSEKVNNRNLYRYAQKFIAKSDFEYMGGIKVQVMYYHLPVESFAENLIKEFNYGIDQAYYDGEKVYTSEAFEKDKASGTATLLNLGSIEDLPKAMKKFMKFQEKYPDFKFASTRLGLVPEGEEVVTENKNSNVWSDEFPATPRWNRWNAAIDNRWTIRDGTHAVPAQPEERL